MKSYFQINFDYQKAREQAAWLDAMANKLEKEVANQKLDSILNDTNNAWRSDHSKEYIKKGQKVQEDIRASARNLRRVANAIRTIAKNLWEAEMEAWRIANE